MYKAIGSFLLWLFLTTAGSRVLAQEKLFLHTDKEVYLAGELCWFKLYVIDADTHRPLDLSKVGYVEWLDSANRPVLQAKVGLQKGRGSGSVYLPMTLRSGNYTLRAYTSWMKNDGADWCFSKTIAVVGDRSTSDTVVAAAPVRYQTSFFPEGGNLVEGIESRVAFCIKDGYGRGVNGSGVVEEDDKDTVARFYTTRLGIGHFSLTPRPGHRYRSTVRLADGTAISSLLPAAYKEGVVMRVSGAGDGRLKVVLTSNGDGKGLYLIAHTRRSVKVTEAVALNGGGAVLYIDSSRLGEGISQLTVFDAARQPVCERLVFRMPDHPLGLRVRSDKAGYGLRDRITLKVDSDAAVSASDYSLSVFRVDSLESSAPMHIGPYFWLASDLRGRIESPNYYFEHSEDTTALDDLLLSQGWRRFRWEQGGHRESPSFRYVPEYDGAILSGKVVDAGKGTAGKHVNVYLSVPGTRTQFATAVSDDEGRVNFGLRDFYGGQEVIVQTDPGVDSQYRVDLISPFLDMYAEAAPPLLLSAAAAAAVPDRELAVRVLNRYGGMRLKQFSFPPGVDTVPFYNKADYTYLLDNYTRFTTMEEVLREYVTNIQVRRRGGHFEIGVFNMPASQPIDPGPIALQVFDKNPLVLLDGVPVFNMDTLMTLDPLKIRRLETLQRRCFLGAATFDGILNWTTYKGDLAGYVLDPRATVVDYEGLQLQREFYSPVYGTEEERKSHLPDFRNVLYWSPSLDGETHGATFYSSDIPGRYRVVVEGLSPEGRMGTATTEFEVK